MSAALTDFYELVREKGTCSYNLANLIPPHCKVPIIRSQLLLSTFLIFGVVISYLPQQVKIIKNKSSQGLSPWYLLLGAVSSISNLLNIIVLQVPETGQCLYNLLGFFQTVSQVTMFLSVFGLFYLYFPTYNYPVVNSYEPIKQDVIVDAVPDLNQQNHDETAIIDLDDDWGSAIKALKIIIAYAITSASISILLVSVFDVPSTAVTIWTAFLALVALVSSTIQFLPQIKRTHELKIVGALSIPAMMMQTPGSFLFCYTIAMSPGTNFTSWVTYFVGGCLQGVLLILCIYYHFKGPVEFIHVKDETTDDQAAAATTSFTSK